MTSERVLNMADLSEEQIQAKLDENLADAKMIEIEWQSVKTAKEDNAQELDVLTTLKALAPYRRDVRDASALRNIKAARWEKTLYDLTAVYNGETENSPNDPDITPRIREVAKEINPKLTFHGSWWMPSWNNTFRWMTPSFDLVLDKGEKVTPEIIGALYDLYHATLNLRTESEPFRIKITHYNNPWRDEEESDTVIIDIWDGDFLKTAMGSAHNFRSEDRKPLTKTLEVLHIM